MGSGLPSFTLIISKLRHCPCDVKLLNICLKYNQQDATISPSIYFYKLLYMFQAVSPPIIRSTKRYIQLQVLSNQYCFYVPCAIVGEMELSSISSTTATGKSIDLTILDAICTVLCSWWWAEEPLETCRAIYRNK
jgi:hypothetical protein